MDESPDPDGGTIHCDDVAGEGGARLGVGHSIHSKKEERNSTAIRFEPRDLPFLNWKTFFTAILEFCMHVYAQILSL